MSLFVHAYALARRARLLGRPWFDALFSRSYFVYKRLVEDPFHALLRSRPELLRGGHVVDVGANIGYHARLFARGLDPGWMVVAIEPEPRNFAMLERNLRRLGVADRVTAVRAAAGSIEGFVELWRNEDHHGDHRVATRAFRALHPAAATESVPMVTVDALVATLAVPRVAFVKIDVQGYEPEVVAGMSRTLVDNPSIAVAFELAPDGMRELGHDPVSLLAHFRAMDFRLELVGRDGLLPAPDTETVLAACGRRGYVDVLARRP